MPDPQSSIAIALNWLFSGVAWELLRALIIAVISTALVRKFFDRISSGREVTLFGAGVFVIILMCFASSTPTASRYKLVGTITNDLYGGTQSPGLEDSAPRAPNTAVFIYMNITNVGDRQTIARNFRVRLTLNQQTYDGELAVMPEQAHLKSRSGSAKTIYRQDQIIDKAITPIVPGGEVVGILYANFPQISPDELALGEPKFDVSFDDIDGKTYQCGHMDTVKSDSMQYVPGIKQD